MKKMMTYLLAGILLAVTVTGCGTGKEETAAEAETEFKAMDVEEGATIALPDDSDYVIR